MCGAHTQTHKAKKAFGNARRVIIVNYSVKRRGLLRGETEQVGDFQLMRAEHTCLHIRSAGSRKSLKNTRKLCLHSSSLLLLFTFQPPSHPRLISGLPARPPLTSRSRFSQVTDGRGGQSGRKWEKKGRRGDGTNRERRRTKVSAVFALVPRAVTHWKHEEEKKKKQPKTYRLLVRLRYLSHILLGA